MSLLPWGGDGPDAECACAAGRDGPVLTIASGDCPIGEPLADPHCRSHLVTAIGGGDVDRIVIRAAGSETWLEGDAAALFVAASRFADRAVVHDRRIADRVTRDPLAAASAVAARAGPVERLGVSTGLTALAADVEGYDDLRRFVGPAIAQSRVAPTPPDGARLVETTELATGSRVRVYAVPGRELPVYHLAPASRHLDDEGLATLARARERIVAGDTTAYRAVRAVADDPGASSGGDPDRHRGRTDGDPPATTAATVGAVLEKHTSGYGVLEDLFSDEAVSDVYASAPAPSAPLRLRRDGTTMRTNVRLTVDGAAALASRLRRDSGRAFSRASPTIDAEADLRGTTVRAAGITAPASDGRGFAFRSHGDRAWTVPALIANDTLAPREAGLLSLAVERDAALLVAGARGAGKTTLLGALLWELPAATRLLVVEDTPELPVDALRDAGRDVQAVRTDTGDGPGLAPDDALRAALRFGESALVVGEVRGPEAAVLYEAMRVGAGGSAVLGTIHGEGATAVRDRVVADLGVPGSSFAATDLVVTLADGRTGRGVDAFEEVLDGDGDGGPRFERLARSEGSPDRVARGNSHLLAALARPRESYADVLAALRSRVDHLATLADRGETSPSAVVRSHARRRTDDEGVCAP